MKFKIGSRVVIHASIQKQWHLPFDATIGTIVAIEKSGLYSVTWDDGMKTNEKTKDLKLAIEPNNILKEIL